MIDSAIWLWLLWSRVWRRSLPSSPTGSCRCLPAWWILCSFSYQLQFIRFIITILDKWCKNSVWSKYIFFFCFNLSSIIPLQLSSDTHDRMAKEYEKAGAICSQVLGNIKTVIACNGQTHEITELENRNLSSELPVTFRYRKYLGTARSCALKFRTMNRIIYATSVFAMWNFELLSHNWSDYFRYFIEFIAYYFGTFYVYDGILKGGEVVRVLFSIFFASQCFKEGGRTLTQIGISIASTRRLVEMMQMVKFHIWKYNWVEETILPTLNF